MRGPGSGSTSSPVSATTSARASPGCSTRATHPRSPPWTRCARSHRSGPRPSSSATSTGSKRSGSSTCVPPCSKAFPPRRWSGSRAQLRMSKPSAIAALREPRRTATVAALFHTLEATAQDDAAELAEGLLTDLVRDAEASVKKARLRSLRDLDDAAMLLREMGRLVMAHDALPLDHWRDALFERGPTGRAGDRHGRGRRHRAARRGQTLRRAPRPLAPRAAAVLQHRHPHRHGRGPGRAGGQGRRLPSQGHPGLVGRQAAGRADRGRSQGVAPARPRPRRKSRRPPAPTSSP